MPAADLLSWKDVGTKLLLDTVAVTRRNLRPPSPESPLLRAELIHQTEEIYADSLPDGETAETFADQLIEELRIHSPEFLSLSPADEHRLEREEPLATSRKRIKAAREIISERRLRLSDLGQELVSRLPRTDSFRAELLAQLLEAEIRATSGKP